MNRLHHVIFLTMLFIFTFGEGRPAFGATPTSIAQLDADEETSDDLPPLEEGDLSITEETVDEDEAPPKPEPPYPGSQADEGLVAQAPPGDIVRPPDSVVIPAPVSISEDGVYFYGVTESEQSASSSIRMGFFAPPPKIVNPKNDLMFDQIYGNQAIPAVFFDYEWQLTDKIGGLGLKAGTGLFTKSAKGRFAERSRADETPDEQFTFFMLPNMISGIYRFQYADKQPFVPWVEGGAGYFTFIETRDDGKRPKFGAAPVTMVAGGGNFLLDWLDYQAIRNLDNDYGINHVWLTAEFKVLIGLNSRYDFTSSVISAGLNFEF